MRNVTLLLTATLSLSLSALACERQSSPRDSPEAVHEGHEGHTAPARQAHGAMQLPADKPLEGTSLFHLESTWQSQAGADVKLESLAGSPVVLAMVYTHCQSACPRIVADMKAIAKGLSEEQRSKARFVLVSLDPERDTVERLAEFAKQASLDEKQWLLLRGEQGSVRELAAVLGMKYRPQAPNDFAHSNLITMLDTKGTIVHQQEGLGNDPSGAIRTLSAQFM